VGLTAPAAHLARRTALPRAFQQLTAAGRRPSGLTTRLDPAVNQDKNIPGPAAVAPDSGKLQTRPA
jgi:hypothetical protein